MAKISRDYNKMNQKSLKFVLLIMSYGFLFSCKSGKKFYDENTEFHAFSYPTEKPGIKPWSLKTENTETKTVVINFFAPDCPPCITELPELEKFKAKQKGTGVAFVSVGSNLRAVRTDETDPDENTMKKELSQFIQKHKISGPVFYAGTRALENFGVTGFPETFVFRKNKKGAYILQKKMISAITEKELTETIAYGNIPLY